ncbi:MAG: transporter substrate-binding domain-containing protein, partial [Gammaproteobacteria bacterium]|nr:transporter substrate-binding domain-containing protein [Gammaproteobacteria bacterium]MBU1644869.1 transporter substrate-binding domain-containing protein [Gammaproteobacteria bacterium]MBU1973102.1 transporter substrate-binding domain-containing protein [Gammaproteobacteria bacterium]
MLLLLLVCMGGLGIATPARAADATPALSLSSTEREWLAAHPVVRLGIDAGYAPYSFVDPQGRPQGVVAEFLPRIEGLLGIRFEVVTDLNWLELMDAVRNKRLDAVATVVHLPEREAFLAFSGIYLPTPLVVMTRADTPQLKSLQDLAALSLVLVEGYSSSKQLTALYPELRPSYVTAPLAGLRALSLGEADAYVGALGVNSHLAARHGFANIKVNAAFDMETNGQRFGVRNDWPQLAQLLDKALAAIPPHERDAIFEKWLPVQDGEIGRLGQPGAAALLFPWLLALAGFALIGYVAQLTWNRQLKRELARRRHELEQAQAIDMAERKRAEETRTEIEASYRALFEHMTAGFVLFKVVVNEAGLPADLVILAANRGFEVTTGLQASNVIGKRLAEVLPGIEQDAADWIGTYGQIALGGEPRQLEQHSELLGRFYAVAAYQPVAGQCAVTFTDVSERKQAEIELAKERGFLKALIQTMPDMVWMKDPAGAYVVCNLRFEWLIGKDEADILGKTDYDFFDRELADAFRDHDRKAIDAGRPTMNEEDVTFANDGHHELLQTIKTPIYDAAGNLMGVLGIARDITAARQAQQQIRKLSLAVEQSPESIVITNIDAEIEYVNEAFLRVTGYTRDEVIGQ